MDVDHIRYRITHTTTYTGTEPISVGHNQAWLRPRSLPWQSCHRYELKICPSPSIISERTDYFGNVVSQFSFNHGYDDLTVTAVSEVSLCPPHGTISSDLVPWEAIRDDLSRHATEEHLAACEFRFPSPRIRPSQGLEDYALKSFGTGTPIVAGLLDLLARMYEDFEFNALATNVTTPIEEVLRNRRGVCQDFAHLAIGALRSIGLAARYVSGYLRTYPQPGQPRLQGADASHAWLSVYCGLLGWVDIDPTNNLFPSIEHVTLAWGRDYGDVTPLKGVYIGGGAHLLRVGVDVEPIDETGQPLP